MAKNHLKEQRHRKVKRVENLKQHIMKNIIVIITAALYLGAFFTMPRASYAQDGSLDLSFDTNGIVTTDIGNYSNIAYSVAIQVDGKIVIAGKTFGGADDDFALLRYNPNGTFDNTFDTDGIVITQVGSNNDNAYAIALQPDGKILVAGHGYGGSSGDFALVRYNTTGSLDTTFDTDGMVLTDIGTNDDYGRALAIQTDGKIVVAGYSSNGSHYDIALARYNINGSLDNSFDSDGIVTTDIGNYGDIAYSVAIQADGKIVVAGYTESSISSDFALARYTTTGSLDTSFDVDGIVTTDIGTYVNRAYSLAIQTDGKIVVAGYTENGISSDFALARYTANGSIDTSFDGDGIVTTDIANSSDEAYSLTIQSDGKIVAAGYGINNSNYEFCLTKYNVNGSLDNTFDADGIVTTNLASYYSYAFSVAMQPDGKIVAAGSAQITNGGDDFSITRYNNSISTGINAGAEQNAEIIIFPNPFSIQTTLRTETILQNATLTIYNLFGVKVKEIENISGQTVTISRYNLASGLYNVLLTDENKIIAKRKLVIPH